MSDKASILIVDDEPALRLFLGEELLQAGYAVLTAASGEEALVRLQEEPIDLILLDLRLGGMDGLQVMAEVARRPLPPVVILLTAHASLDSAIEAMRRGGHDYLVKPFRKEELLASVEKGLARRREMMQQQRLLRLIESSVQQLQNGSRPVSEPASSAISPASRPDRPTRFLEGRGLLLDREQQQVTRQGQVISLTPTEFQLLLCLMEHRGRVVTYGELMQGLHGEPGDAWEARQALSTHLWRLRKKIGDDPDGTPYIVNERGRGYRFAHEAGVMALD